MAEQGNGRILAEEQQKALHQEAEKPVGLFAGILRLFEEHKTWLEEKVAELRERQGVTDTVLPLPQEVSMLDRMLDFISGTQAPEREYIVANISGDNTMLQPNPEYVPPPRDAIAAELGDLKPTPTPIVAQSRSTVLSA